MSERAINLTEWEVLAFLAGRKTRITRPWKNHPKRVHAVHADGRVETEQIFRRQDRGARLPYIAGDVLWGKEKFRRCPSGNRADGIVYGADKLLVFYKRGEPEEAHDLPRDGRWRSPVTMPRWASRITREVVEVSLIRVQNMTEEMCREEGIYGKNDSLLGYIETRFIRLWNARYSKRGLSWDSNPWVVTARVKDGLS